MKTFDYETAWREVAKPAYLALPASIHELIAEVARQARDLHQDQTCAMIWPESPALADLYAAVPAADLAWAAAIVHDAGHWFPAGGDLEIPGRAWGNHWKFSNYADQDLRVRLALPKRGSNHGGQGWSREVHEGVCRLCYSSRHMWTWAEVCPATPADVTDAGPLFSKLTASSVLADRRRTRERDNQVYTAIETFRKTRRQASVWPNHWQRIAFAGEDYQVEQVELDARREQQPANLAKTRARVDGDLVRTIDKARAQHAGYVWLLDRGQAIENVIYYDHIPEWCFGWRSPLTESQVSTILDWISEFPWPYKIKCLDGRTLEGGKG